MLHELDGANWLPAAFEPDLLFGHLPRGNEWHRSRSDRLRWGCSGWWGCVSVCVVAATLHSLLSSDHSLGSQLHAHICEVQLGFRARRVLHNAERVEDFIKRFGCCIAIRIVRILKSPWPQKVNIARTRNSSCRQADRRVAQDR